MRADVPSEEWMQFDLHHVAQEWNEPQKAKHKLSSHDYKCVRQTVAVV